MFSSIKTIIEFVSLLMETFRFIAGYVNEQTYLNAVKKRRKNYKKFIEADRRRRLELLREENKDS